MSDQSLWIKKPLKYFVKEMGDGGTPSRDEHSNFGGDIPWVVIGDIQREIYKTKESLSVKGLASCTSKLWPENTIILSTGATIGKVGIAKIPLATKQGITGILVNNNVIPSFFYYMLSFKKPMIIAWAQGSTFAEIRVPILGKIPLKIPSSHQIQLKIVNILQTIDQAIESTEALINKYQKIKAGLMHDLLTRGITAEGKFRPTREQAPELYQETPIGWIPKDWDFSTLSKKACIGVPHLRTGPFGSALKGEHWVDDGHPVITIGALGEGKFIISELLYIGEDDARRLSDFKLKNGDVVFSRVADVGRSVVIEEDQVDWIMSSNLMRISLDRAQVLPKFLQYQLAADIPVKKQIRCKVNAGGRDVANSDILNSLLFVWPSPDEQANIVMRASSIDTRINNELCVVQKLYQQKMGLMNDLLRGIVPVKIDETKVIHV